MSNTPPTQEIQRFYEINSSLNLAQDMGDILLSLKATVALDAVAIVHVALEKGSALLAHLLDADGVLTALDEAIALQLPKSIDSVEPLDVATSAPPIADLLRHYGAKRGTQLAIKVDDSLTDVIYALFSDTQAFTDAQIRLFEAFAAQTAITLQKLRLLHAAADYAERLSRQVRVLETLNTLANSVGRGIDEQEVMVQTMQTLVAATGADHAGVVVIDADGKMGTVVSEYPSQGAVGIRIEVEGNPVFTELLAGRNTPFLINDIQNDAQITPLVAKLLSGIGTKSIIITPLVIGGELIGSVGLDLYTMERQFEPEVVDLVSALTSQLAVYLQDARTRQERQTAADQAQRLDAVSSRFIALNSVDDLLHEAVRSLSELVDAKRVIIRLGTPDATERTLAS